MLHCRWVLEQQGFPVDEPAMGPGPGPGFGSPADMSSWYSDGPGPGMKRPMPEGRPGGPDTKRRGHPGQGWQRPPHPGNLQWTPAGWVNKDNAHKVRNEPVISSVGPVIVFIQVGETIGPQLSCSSSYSLFQN